MSSEHALVVAERLRGGNPDLAELRVLRIQQEIDFGSPERHTINVAL